MAAWAAGSNVDRIAAVRAPVLAAAGSSDVVIPPENAAALARLYPDAWLARFPGCGHAFMAQEPERLAAADRGLPAAAEFRFPLSISACGQ